MAKANDLDALRRTFDGGRGDRPSHNVALQLCDEVERLRATNAELAINVARLSQDALSMALALLGADVLARAVDETIIRGAMDARSPVGDARLNYGQPFEYKWTPAAAPEGGA